MIRLVYTSVGRDGDGLYTHTRYHVLTREARFMERKYRLGAEEASDGDLFASSEFLNFLLQDGEIY